MVECKVSAPEDLKQKLTTTAKSGTDGVTAMDRVASKMIAVLPYISLLFMTYSAATSAYESKVKGDYSTFTFVISSFVLLLLLYLSMWEFERTRRSPTKRNAYLKALIWVLSVTLTVVFAIRVTSIVDSVPLEVFVWSVAALTSLSGFYFLFVLPQPN